MQSIRIIGPGRAGTSLAAALAAQGWDVIGFLGRHDDLTYAADGVDILVIATPDDVIAPTAAAVTPRPGTTVLHLSGSLGLDALAPHPRRAALHPLVPLPNAAVGATRLASGVTFAVSGEPVARLLALSLGGRVVEVADADRAVYHAAACIAANRGGPAGPGRAGGGLRWPRSRGVLAPDKGGGGRCGGARTAPGADRSGRTGRLGHLEPPP